MKTLLNTSFFFTPEVNDHVRETLRKEWIPACNASGSGPAICLMMPLEEGVIRLAVQTPFNDAESAERFREVITAQVADSLTRTLGADAFTCFSTIMEIINP